MRLSRTIFTISSLAVIPARPCPIIPVAQPVMHQYEDQPLCPSSPPSPPTTPTTTLANPKRKRNLETATSSAPAVDAAAVEGHGVDAPVLATLTAADIPNLSHEAMVALCTRLLPLLPLLAQIPQPAPPLEPPATATAPAKRACTTRAVTSFTSTAQVAAAFGLDYAPLGSAYRFRLGRPKSQLSLTRTYHCLMRIITSHTKNFDRSSEAICRTAVDLLLNECLIILKGQGFDSAGQLLTVAAASNRPLNPCADMVIVNGEIEVFWHDADTFTSYSGRVDYGVGIAAKKTPFPHRTSSGGTNSGVPKRTPYPYAALLLCVEAKHEDDVDSATAQLAGYMAIIHRLRLAAKSRTPWIDPCVYGIATDGLTYDFLQITGDSVLRKAPRIEIVEREDVARLVEGVLWILETELEGKVGGVARSRPGSRVVSGSAAAGVPGGPERDLTALPGGDRLLEEWVAEGAMVDGDALDLANSGYNQPTVVGNKDGIPI